MDRTKRSVALFFAVYFLQGMCFYGPVATLYRQAAGVSVFQIGLTESACMLSMLLLEIPWGWVADRVGHRRTIVLCYFLFALSKVVFWRAETFGGFLAERLILAAALSGLSGCDSAYLFACVGEGESQRAYGRWNAVQTAGLLVAGACSSLILGDRYRLAALWTVVTYSAAALLSLFLAEAPAGETVPAAEQAPRPRLREVIGASRRMAPFLIGAALLQEASQFVATFLAQLQYRRAGIPTRWFGLLYILVTLSTLAGARSHALTGLLGRRRAGSILFALAALACLAMALCPQPLLAGAGVMVLSASAALFAPLSLTIQNAAAPPNLRATQLSCNAMVMDLVSVAMSPALGRAADAGPEWALYLGAAACGLGLLLFLAGAHRNASATSA